jgi:YfiH family protein
MGTARDGNPLRFWTPAGMERWSWLAAVVTTRPGGTSPAPYASLNLGLSTGDRPEHVHANRARLRAALGPEVERWHALHQVHGTDIFEVPGAIPPQGDGLWTQRPGEALVVGVADCVPVFLWDARARRVAVVHAGWRGTAAGIVKRGLELLTHQGARPHDLWMALGPCIGPCCYEVSAEVAARFPEAAVRPQAGRLHLDLRGANRLQALEHGVPEAQVQADPPCTGCHLDRFFSHRKEAQRTGRMWAVAWIRPAGLRRQS